MIKLLSNIAPYQLSLGHSVPSQLQYAPSELLYVCSLLRQACVHVHVQKPHPLVPPSAGPRQPLTAQAGSHTCLPQLWVALLHAAFCSPNPEKSLGLWQAGVFSHSLFAVHVSPSPQWLAFLLVGTFFLKGCVWYGVSAVSCAFLSLWLLASQQLFPKPTSRCSSGKLFTCGRWLRSQFPATCYSPAPTCSSSQPCCTFQG